VAGKYESTPPFVNVKDENEYRSEEPRPKPKPEDDEAEEIKGIYANLVKEANTRYVGVAAVFTIVNTYMSTESALPADGADPPCH
jgi:hypothetical protein